MGTWGYGQRRAGRRGLQAALWGLALVALAGGITLIERQIAVREGLLLALFGGYVLWGMARPALARALRRWRAGGLRRW